MSNVPSNDVGGVGEKRVIDIRQDEAGNAEVYKVQSEL